MHTASSTPTPPHDDARSRHAPGAPVASAAATSAPEAHARWPRARSEAFAILAPAALALVATDGPVSLTVWRPGGGRAPEHVGGNRGVWPARLARTSARRDTVTQTWDRDPFVHLGMRWRLWCRSEPALDPPRPRRDGDGRTMTSTTPCRQPAKWTEVGLGAAVLAAAYAAHWGGPGASAWGIASALMAACLALRALASPKTRDVAFALLCSSCGCHGLARGLAASDMATMGMVVTCTVWSIMLQAAAIAVWCVRISR